MWSDRLTPPNERTNEESARGWEGEIAVSGEDEPLTRAKRTTLFTTLSLLLCKRSATWDTVRFATSKRSGSPQI